MRIGSPMAAPGMVPTEMRAEEGHDHPIAAHLIVVGAEPIEATVKRDVPRIAHAAGNDLQIVTAVIASQHAAIESPIISGIVISAAVTVFVERHWSREVGHIGRRGNSRQISKRFWRKAARLIKPLGVSFAHVQLAVRGPVQTM